ncbi:hypothetical protein F5Y18DRAFT_408800 [Xylariaceae sp. FL1019]|nr:hypothetical protein F5Y18DRAFT_408800 [Xylariaceae sp. FL1019]
MELTVAHLALLLHLRWLVLCWVDSYRLPLAPCTFFVGHTSTHFSSPPSVTRHAVVPTVREHFEMFPPHGRANNRQMNRHQTQCIRVICRGTRLLRPATILIDASSRI